MPDQSARTELRTELLVLQAVRLAGVADTDAVLDRTFLSDEAAARVLAEVDSLGAVEQFSFGDTSGWLITEAGSARLATLLSDEVASRDATAVLVATLDAFEPLNDRFVGLVSRWQLESTSSASTGFGSTGTAEVDELLTSLTSVGADLRATLADLTRALPRFGRYPAQYAAAVDRARHDGLRWITGVGLLSCHVVWAELHQDLLSSLGRDRLDDRANR